MTRRAVGAAVALLAVFGAGPVRALFAPADTENVPIDRVTKNLEAQVAANPSDVQTRLNLARIYAMAWASKTETVPVLTKPIGRIPIGEPYYGPYPGFQNVQTRQTSDPAVLAAAKTRLMQAIAQYEAVLKLDPSSTVALLGQSWCLDQAGDKTRAIAGYRRVIELIWQDESGGKLPGLQNIRPTTTEVAGYLIPLLDPAKDADEIATLKSHVSQLAQQMSRRPITPVVVPIGVRDDVRRLVDDRARVVFDADGSGVKRGWTWITPDAGWLVFDRQGRGEITSALQWFGSVTFWLFWENGYEAMRALDDDGDGALSGRELAGLAVWRDRNADGLAQAGEVRSVASLGIVRLSCAYERPDDDPAIAAWSPQGVSFANGVTRPTYDVVLFPR